MKGIEFAVPLFHQYGLYPIANLGITRNIDSTFTSEPRAK